MMLKRFTVALAMLFALAAPAFAAGTISLSMSQRLDQFGHPLAGGKLFFFQAGTVATPQNAFQDSALTIPYPNPIVLDSAGNVPPFYLADGTIKIRLTDASGVVQLTADNLLVVGASSGGGGGGSVDPTTIIATGDIKARYGTGVLAGFVRANGRTIGSATSGATERANADCDALFEYLWNTDANLAVSGGRGVSSASDWAANKTIALPDWRGRVIAGLDDMGNAAAGRLSNTGNGFGNLSTILGAAGGGESETLSLAQLPTGITSTGTLSVTGNSNAALSFVTSNSQSQNFSTNAGGAAQWTAYFTSATLLTQNANAAGTVTSNNTSGGPHSRVQPTMLATIYLKL